MNNTKQIWAHEVCLEAQRCVEVCEKDPRYEIGMSTWHSPDMDGNCMVCVAGAWMAIALGVKHDRFMMPCELPDLASRLIAISMEHLRTGNIIAALKILNQEHDYRNTIALHKDVVNYHYSPTKWKEDMLSLADYLKENFMGDLKQEAVVEQPQLKEMVTA